MAARKTIGTVNAPWPERVRERIRASMLHNELIKHVNGKREMSQTQLAAAKTLLDKVLPSLTENDTRVSGELTVNIVQYAGRNPSK